MIYDLAHGNVALLVIDVQREYFPPDGAAAFDSFCCETTARDAHGRDYEVLFVADANEGPGLEDQQGQPVSHVAVLQSTLTALSAGFAEAVTTTDVLARVNEAQRGT